jgi:signal transduction histidine kinase
MFGAMCSLLFAMSFVHFGYGHPLHAWSSELALHHAGIPLALFVLLQDYRFVLLDAFIRFLANALLAAILTFALFRIAFNWVLIAQQPPVNPIYHALLLLGFCLLLIGFALVRSQIQHWLTKVVFQRSDLNKLLQEMHARAALFNDEPEFLQWAFQQLGQFMSTDRVREVAEPELADSLGGEDLFFPAPASDIAGLRHSTEFGWVEAVAPIRLAREDVRYLLLGRRRGGRRYLSEDLQSLSRIMAVIAQEVERFRNSEMQRLVSQAELRALQSQINPHFLFNALNTLYGIIPRGASGARKTVLNLAEIFRYCLQSEKSFIPLSDELQIVNAYLDIERLRLGPRLETEIEIDENALPVLIPILSIQPLVENAIKHGLSTKSEPGLLRLQAKMRDNEVVITVQDTGPGMSGPVPGNGQTRVGVGLANVKRRLRLCYGPDADLLIESSSEGTKIQFAIPLLAQVDGV